MIRHYEGKYAAKHTVDIKPDEKIAEAIKGHLQNGKLSCASACAIAQDMNVSLAAIGRNADLIEARITKCLLGFFGHRSPDGEKLKPEPVESVSKNVEDAISAHMQNGMLTCAALWEVGQETNISKKELGRICQTLKVKIVRCQLDAF
jgi:hypothetical protein